MIKTKPRADNTNTETAPRQKRIVEFTLKPIIPANITPPNTNFDRSKA